MTNPTYATVKTLEDLLDAIEISPNKHKLKSIPVRLFSKMVATKRHPAGEQLCKFVAFSEGSERRLNHLLTTLFPKLLMPSATILAGQSHSPENVLLACQLNTADAKRPYRLNKAKLVKQHPTLTGNSTYRVYCEIRKQWSNAAQAGHLRRSSTPRFLSDSPMYWQARATVGSFGGCVVFTSEVSQSGHEYCDYVCQHGISHTVTVGSLAVGKRPTANCRTCRDIVYAEANANQTGSINHSTNLDLSSRVPKNTSGTLYVIQATHTATGVPFIKVGYSVNGLNGRYGKKLEGPLSNIKTRSFKFDEITARCYESICHSVLQEHKVALGATDLPEGFRAETYHPDCLPLLKSTLTYLRDLPMPDLITHPLAIDGISNMTPTRTRKLRKLSDSKTRRRTGVWSDYT